MKLRVDESKLTIGDLEDFEEHAGVPIDEAMQMVPAKDPETGGPLKDAKGRPVMTTRVRAKHLKVLIWICARMDNPGFTLDEARHVRVNEISWVPAQAANPKEPMS